MNVLIAAIGKLKPGPKLQLFDYYATRAGWKITCSEYEVKTQLAGTARKAREAELLLKAVAGLSHIVALDEKGDLLSSMQFAAHIAKARDAGCRTLGFVIGGADGLDESVLARAQLVLSFGRVTWPHLLMRVLLAEQLYRAHTIASGHPYHRE